MYFWQTLQRFGSRPALLHGPSGSISYAELADRADRFAGDARAILPDGVPRPLLIVETMNEIEPIAAYLGALRAGWPVILQADGATAQDRRVAESFRPNLIVRRRAGALAVEPASAEAADMHPDLAVLLSTSGTTGAPKLVRLSGRNLEANARSIGEYLGIGPEERAMATLPFHYSYGMAVLHSHLAHGGALVLNEDSVANESFWSLFRAREATSLALVPFQFELLDRTGFAERALPSLRYVTQAGGKLTRQAVERFAGLGRAAGWKLFVMYGQTEASPRMAYLPPEDIATHADSIGRAVPGGRFELIDEGGRAVTGTGVAGELVYFGPNVMLGYASARDGLADPAGPERLETGDLAERLENGYFRIIGRKSRFVKLFGLRIGLDEAEDMLRGEGLAAWCSGDDSCLVAFVADGAMAAKAEALLAGRYGLPARSVRAEAIEAPPLLPSGKIDYRGLAAMARELAPRADPETSELEAVLAGALRTDRIDLDRSFAELGGDSLSYIEVQMALMARLGQVPAGWEEMPLRSLLDRPPEQAPHGVWQPVPFDLIARVLALIGVILLHSTDVPSAGGAYLLTLLVGASLARFQWTQLRSGRALDVLRTQLVPILACYYAVIVATVAASRPVDPAWLLLLGNFGVPPMPAGFEPYWFVCLYAQLMVLICLPFAVPRLRAAVGERPFAAGLLVLAATVAICLALDLADRLGDLRPRHPLFALQLVSLGWCARHARNNGQKAVVSLLLLADVALFWRGLGPMAAPALVLGGLGTIWLASVRAPAAIGKVLMTVGMSAMFIYLVHPIVVSIVHGGMGLRGAAAFLLSLAGSVVAGAGAKRVYDGLHRWLRTSARRIAGRLGSARRAAEE